MFKTSPQNSLIYDIRGKFSEENFNSNANGKEEQFLRAPEYHTELSTIGT